MPWVWILLESLGFLLYFLVVYNVRIWVMFLLWLARVRTCGSAYFFNVIPFCLLDGVLCVWSWKRQDWGHRVRSGSLLSKWWAALTVHSIYIIHHFHCWADFLGSTSIKISELLADGQSPWIKRQLLEHVHTGEIEFKLEYEDIKIV